MPTIHISKELMNQINENKRSDEEPPTRVLERMIDYDIDTLEQKITDKVEEKIMDKVVSEALE